VGSKGGGGGEINDPNIVCTYELKTNVNIKILWNIVKINK
jgi:hypothetical protein